MSAEATDPFEELASQIRTRLEDEPDDDFKMTILKGVQRIEVTEAHRNNVQAARCILSAVEAHYAKDDTAARILLFVAGAIVNDKLARATWFALNHIPGVQAAK